MNDDHTAAAHAAGPPPGTSTSPSLEARHAGDEMLTIAEVAALIRVPVATLRYWRHLGSGPRSFRIGRSVRYWRSEVWAWIENQTRKPHGTGSRSNKSNGNGSRGNR